MLRQLLSSLLAWLLGKTSKPEPEPEPILPTSTKRIDYGDLYALLRIEAPQAEIFLSDKEYLLCNKADIRAFLAQDETNKMGYVPEARDCDDFSYRLMGQLSIPGWSDLAFGIIWTNLHAMNCFVTEDKLFYYVEPQNDFLQHGGLLPQQGNVIRLIVM